MKSILFRAIALIACATATAWSQTINWGSEVLSDLRDSNGQIMASDFVFELGAFAPGFVPSETNVDDWLANWYVFDRAVYNDTAGYFTGTTQMTDAGQSTSSSLSAPPGYSFEGADAYLWIRSGDDPVPGSEWLVLSTSEWRFPTASPGCCDNQPPSQFSVSDLSGEIPNWGRQGEQQGPGEYTNTSDFHSLQTYTFVPEPSAFLLSLLSAGLLFRRRR